MKATAILEVEFESEDAFSEEDVKMGIEDYVDIANEYCGNIKLCVQNISSVTVKENDS